MPGRRDGVRPVTLPLPCLCLVTDRAACGPSCLEWAAAQAVQGGVNMVQLREKDMPGGTLLEVACGLKEAIQGKALLVVNERVDVALACGADGVQLGEEGLPVAVARKLVGADMLIGRSVHTLEGARRAQEGGADFLVVGTIFPTGSHPEASPAGVALLREVAGQVSIPFLAIGGVGPQNVAQVMEAGAWGAATIRAILASQDPKGVAADLSSGMKAAWRGLAQTWRSR